MKRSLLVFAMMACLLFSGIPASGESAPYLDAKRALTLVETSAGTGSGFAVSPTLVATACHVVKGAAAIRLHFWAAEVQLSGRTALCNERADIAFVTVAVPDGTAVLHFAASGPQQGDRIWVWGYPLGTTIALEPSVAAGMISATETPNGQLALDVSGAPGNSGGPVVNDAGEVVGILVAAWSSAQGATGFKYGARGTTAAELLADLPATTAAEGSGDAQPTGTRVRPGEGVGAVQLGMSPAKVAAAIGLPANRRDAHGWYEWDSRKLSVRFDRDEAVVIYTEDPAAVTAEGIRLGSTDVDLIKAYGGPACSSLFPAAGKATLGWVYHGLIVFITGSPRQIAALAVVGDGVANAICR